MQRLRALNAGARLNTLEQCSTPLATQGKGYVSIGMKRHSMSARLTRSQDKRARPSLAPGTLLGGNSTAMAPAQPSQPSSSSGSASAVSAKAQGQGLGPFTSAPSQPTTTTSNSSSSQSQDQQQTLVGPFTTNNGPMSSSSTSASTSANTSAGGKVELPELFASVALDTPFYQAQVCMLSMHAINTSSQRSVYVPHQ